MTRNPNCTSFEIKKSLRTRMKIVAANSPYPTMGAWLEAKIEEDEKKLKI
jgi:hypothetical protein